LLQLVKPHLFWRPLLAGEGLGRIARNDVIQEGSIRSFQGSSEGSRPTLAEDPALSVPDGLARRVSPNQVEIAVELEDGRGKQDLPGGIGLLAVPDSPVSAVKPVSLGQSAHPPVRIPSIDDVSITHLPLFGERKHVLAQREKES